MRQGMDEAQDFVTPPWVLDAVRRMGTIGLDPCPGPHSFVAPLFTVDFPKEDGLLVRWGHRCPPGSLVYLNPPYGRTASGTMGEWMAKAVVEADTGVEIIALIPARTDTEWWQASASLADAILFYRGRIRFHDGKTGKPATYSDKKTGKERPGSGKFPSAFLYFGSRVGAFRRVFGPLGHFVTPA